MTSITTPPAHAPHGAGLASLAANTMAALGQDFAAWGHHPSAEHMDALSDIARTLGDMADGCCDEAVYLSAVDCGVGKSQTVAHFARALVVSPAHKDVGMVICVGRLDEVEAMVAELALPQITVGVLTGDASLNALGALDPNSAQVLVTTQQRIELACRQGRAFSELSGMHYHGAVRQVRAWDEAWLPGAVITLAADDILLLPRLVRRISPLLADALPLFAMTLRDVKDGALIDVPDFAATCGVSLDDVLATAAGARGSLRDDQQLAATALRMLSGRPARVRHDGPCGNAMLTYHDTLPDDLKPLLVLDASGRVRQTYAFIEQRRRSLIRLGETVKDYSPLTIHTWRVSGSKSGWAEHGPDLVEGIADTISTRPDESWLVVVHRPDGRVLDVEAAIKRKLPADVRPRVQCLTWGKHLATNQFADVANVILAGTLLMRPSFYAALTHLAQDRDTLPGLADPAEIAATMRGEHAHLVMQALCRGRVRKSDGSRCLPMNAYVIASTRSGIPDDLARIFPGCRVAPWQPGKAPKPKGAVARALAFVQVRLAAGDDWIAAASIREAIKLDPSTFRRRVAQRSEWKAALPALGVVEAVGQRGARGLRIA